MAESAKDKLRRQMLEAQKKREEQKEKTPTKPPTPNEKEAEKAIVSTHKKKEKKVTPKKEVVVETKRTSLDIPMDTFLAIKFAAAELRMSFKEFLLSQALKNPTAKKHLKQIQSSDK